MVDSIEVSVVVPAKDERDNLAPLIGEIDAALAGKYSYELIYVDDGSWWCWMAMVRTIRPTFPPCWRRPGVASPRTSTRSGSSAIASIGAMTG